LSEPHRSFLCAKAFRRSRLWEPTHWPSVNYLVPAAQMFYDQTRVAGMTVEDYARRLEDCYRTGLY
jgi:hypothetical protein